MRAIWEQLRAKYPSDFCTSPQEVSEWDTLQAQENERSHHWSAAAFHLKRLLALHPEDHALADRLAAAQQQK